VLVIFFVMPGRGADLALTQQGNIVDGFSRPSTSRTTPTPGQLPRPVHQVASVRRHRHGPVRGNAYPGRTGSRSTAVAEVDVTFPYLLPFFVSSLARCRGQYFLVGQRHHPRPLNRGRAARENFRITGDVDGGDRRALPYNYVPFMVLRSTCPRAHRPRCVRPRRICSPRARSRSAASFSRSACLACSPGVCSRSSLSRPTTWNAHPRGTRRHDDRQHHPGPFLTSRTTDWGGALVHADGDPSDRDVQLCRCSAPGSAEVAA